METTRIDVLVHVNEDLSEEAMLRVQQDVREGDGVISVDQRPGHGHFLMVGYDSELTRAATILQPFRNHGLHAQLIGL